MARPMSDRQRQQRAAMIVGGAAIGGLAIVGLAIALSSGGGDDTNAIDVSRSSTTSSSTTSSTSTSTSTSTTTTLVTLPPTLPPTAPPTVVVIPTAPPTSPPTSPPTTKPVTTTTKPVTTTTKPPTPAQQLALELDTALNGGLPPDPGQERVSVKPLAHNKQVSLTWKLDDTLPPDEQQYQAREDALLLLTTIQGADPPGNDKMTIKATVPKAGGGTKRVILLVIDRSEFDAYDFSGFDPDDDDVFALPFVTSSDIDTDVVPDPYPPSPDESTTTTEETTTTSTT